MNYQRIYTELIERAQSRILDKKETYFESHHIIPKCLGGLDILENLVNLTGREHFLAHWLLCRIYPENAKLAHAFFAMCRQKRDYQKRYTPSSRVYNEAKEKHAKFVSLTRTGIKHTLEHREKNRQASLKKRHTEETRQKMSRDRKCRVVSEDTKKKLSESHTGMKMPPRDQAYRDKMSKSKTGFKHSEETKQKLRERVISEETRRKNSESHLNKTRIICSCGREILGKGNYDRHFNSCKYKQQIA